MAKAIAIKDGQIVFNRLTRKSYNKLKDVGVEVRRDESGELVADWTYENAARITMLGVNLPCPIYTEYDFPRPNNWEVMKHQYRIADFCARNRRGYVLAGMGSGKTASIAWACDYLKRQGYAKRVLILCPLSVMTDAWLKTIPSLFFMGRTIKAIYGKNKLENMASDVDFHVMNYDGLLTLDKELAKYKWDVVVMDESIKIKNASAQRTKIVKRLVAQAEWAWQLTGKPTPQSPLDAHGQLWVFNKYTHGKNWWQQLTQTKLTEYKWVNKQGWQNIVHQYMQPAIRVETRDCVDLPPLVTVQRYVELTPAQTKAIKYMQENNAITVRGAEVEAPNSAVLRMKLIQIANGAVRANEGEVVEFAPTKRLSAVEDAIEQSEYKTIVYAPFKAVVYMISSYLQKKGYNVKAITGETAVSERQEIFDSFQSDKEESVQIIVAIPDAMAHGVTLTNAAMMIWYSPIYSNDIFRQAVARMERKGQTRHMTMVQIWGHTIERDMYALLATRDDDQDKFLELYQRIMSGLTQVEL